MESQLPPDRGTLPSPILARICLGVSFGPVANGVQLEEEGGGGGGGEGNEEDERTKYKNFDKDSQFALKLTGLLHFYKIKLMK